MKYRNILPSYLMKYNDRHSHKYHEGNNLYSDECKPRFFNDVNAKASTFPYTIGGAIGVTSTMAASSYAHGELFASIVFLSLSILEIYAAIRNYRHSN